MKHDEIKKLLDKHKLETDIKYLAERIKKIDKILENPSRITISNSPDKYEDQLWFYSDTDKQEVDKLCEAFNRIKTILEVRKKELMDLL